MSEKKNDGGPAFPPVDSAVFHQLTGMTLRDYFAAQFISGELRGGWVDTHPEYKEMMIRLAKQAYEFADAMIAERD